MKREVAARPQGRPQESAADALAGALPLAWLAGLAATLDLAWNRIAVLALGGIDDDVALWLLRTGPLWRNLAAVAGLVALITALWTFLRMAGFSTALRRVQVAALSGLLLPGLLLATLFAKESLPPVIVLVAVGVGNALVVILGVATGGYLKSPFRSGIWGAALASVLVLVLLVAASLESVQVWLANGSDTTSKLVWGLIVACRIGGELVWLLMPLVVAWRLWAELEGRAARALMIGVATALLGLALLGETRTHTDFSVIAYGAFRVTVLPEALVALYALPLGVTLGAGIAALAFGSGRSVQVGAFLLLWLAAGFAPRTPVQILYLVVATLSIARAVQASDPDGRRRAALAWGEPLAAPDLTAAVVSGQSPTDSPADAPGEERSAEPSAPASPSVPPPTA